jgi:hypothetical protein
MPFILTGILFDADQFQHHWHYFVLLITEFPGVASFPETSYFTQETLPIKLTPLTISNTEFDVYFYDESNTRYKVRYEKTCSVIYHFVFFHFRLLTGRDTDAILQ